MMIIAKKVVINTPSPKKIKKIKINKKKKKIIFQALKFIKWDGILIIFLLCRLLNYPQNL